MAPLRITVLGGFQARIGSGPPLALPRKAQALLAYLALRPGQDHPRDKLSTLLWADARDADARHSLRQSLYGLRRALTCAPNAVLEGDTLALNADAVEVDAAEFERLVAEGSPGALARAAELYQGDFLEGMNAFGAGFDEWLVTQRERLRELAIEANARLLAHRMRAAPGERAIQTAMRLLALDPLQEVVHRTLMRLYAQQGRRGAALRQYQVCVAVLRRELGVEPEAETKDLYQSLLRHQLRPAAQASAPGRPRPRSRRGGRSPVSTRAHEPPLIGRQAARDHFQRALDGAAGGFGRTVLVLGEAGIGKTRLVDDLIAGAAHAGHLVLVGRCYQSERLFAYRPWIDAIRAGGVLPEIEALAEPSPMWWVELARLFPELGAAEPPTTREHQARLFEAILALIDHLASSRPLIAVLEDVQWADDSSVGLLSFLARRTEGRRVLVVATLRDEDLADSPRLRAFVEEMSGAAAAITLALEPLSRTETTDLVNALARTGHDPGDLEHLAARVWALSEGNPFVIVETMRSLSDGKAAAGAPNVALPRRVREIITSRLDRLSARAQRLATAAAVIGRAFGYDLLHRVAGLTESQTAEGVEELVRRGILTVETELFDFTHQRIREVAYQRLLPAPRRALHAAVGAALEALYPEGRDRPDDALAQHYARAGDAARAVTYLTRVSDQAVRAYAMEGAIHALRDALSLVAQLPAAEHDARSLDIVLRLAFPLSVLGRFQEILDLLLPERARVERLDDAALAGRYHFRVALTQLYLGHHAESASSARQSLEAASRAGDEATIGKAHYVLAFGDHWSGQTLDGVDHARQAIARLERGEERHWLGLSWWILARNQGLLGELDAALDAAARVDAIGAASGDARLRSMAAATRGWVHAMRGDTCAGMDACARALESSPDPVTAASALCWLGYCHLERQEAAEAVSRLEDSRERFLRAGLRLPDGRTAAYLSEAQLLKGDTAEAARLAAEALQLTAADPYGSGLARRALGRVAWAVGSRREAEAHLEAGLRTFAAVQARFEAARLQVLLAELAVATGRPEEAAAHLSVSHQAFTRAGACSYVRLAETLAARAGLRLST